ncbi:S-layer homology domain-containing protein [Salibacterium qingdaonense]|uniref:S-layer homology domain-containing protein n=1 Tax=Salibacterium qingdaonense TaxID=266892 RepID=A0A1I4N9B5_9BACI|nr:S-layer homology domain-containing protein [Salibacterium qingdaonense]SFM12142.1 S-layer homology domain-containing protein [Salibacterium qingdaonense]
MRKFIALAVLFMGTVGMACSGSDVEAANYSDVSDEFWADESIRSLSEQNIISGYPDGTFQPNQPITRIQAASMIVKALDLEVTDRPDAAYEDISAEYDRKNIINAVSEEEIMSGNGEIFRPGEHITRAQMAVVLQNSFDWETSGQESFSDVPADYWAIEAISTAVSQDITTGYEDGTFRPGNATTRAQFSVFLQNALSSGEEEQTSNEAQRGVEVSKDDWTYTIKDHEIIRTNSAGQTERVLAADERNPRIKEGMVLLEKGDWIYYLLSDSTEAGSNREIYHLHRVRTDGSDEEKVLDESVNNPHIYENHLYYVGYDQQENVTSWKKAELDGSNREIIFEDDFKEREKGYENNDDDYYVFERYKDRMYYSNKGETFHMNMDGSNKERIMGMNSFDLEVTEGLIFSGSPEGLLAINPDTDERTTIRGGDFYDFVAFGNDIFAFERSSGLFRFDGDERTWNSVEKEIGGWSLEYATARTEKAGDDGLMAFTHAYGDNTYLLGIRDGDIVVQETLNQGYEQMQTEMENQEIEIHLKNAEESSRESYRIDLEKELIESIDEE